ncbi:MAG: choice-of-anchor tandem repeat GloVer-containing protein [Candidatus Cybelea sp.]
MRITFLLLAAVLLASCARAGGSAAPGGVIAQRVQPATNNYAPLYSFRNSPDGRYPEAGLVSVSGTLYGTTSLGGKDSEGTVFSLTKTDKESVLYSFRNAGDGESPFGGLLAVGSEFYGTTADGGAGSAGSLFRVGVTGAERILYSFTQRSGTNPYSGLIKLDNDFYGTASAGGTGSGNSGTVFEVSKNGTEHTIYNFHGADGATPNANLIAVNGVLYGTTQYGGSGEGTVFAVTPSGTESVLHTFGGGSDGAVPRNAGLVAIDGALYGTTCSGGTHGDGTVFMLAKSRSKYTERVLYNFGDHPEDGSCPSAGLTLHGSVLYGTAYNGGSLGEGAIFKVTLLGTESVLYSFKGKPDGTNPMGTLLAVGDTLYGTTSQGGNGFGTVFRITP